MGCDDFGVPVFSCVNCGKDIPSDRPVKIFCSDLCREECKYVRYYRECIADGRARLPDVRQALAIRLGHVLSGGYQASERHVPQSARVAVIERDGGRCRRCGRPGSVLHHIQDASSDPANLELLCAECHNAITASRLRPLDVEDTGSYMKAIELEVRSHIDKPVHECDDPQRWPFRQREIVRQRKQLYCEAIGRAAADLLNKGLTKTQVAEMLTDCATPTLSGHGTWTVDRLREVLKVC